VVRGTRVLNTAGFEVGTVDDVMFDAASGELTGATTTGGYIEAKRFKAVGSYALIVEVEGQ
jgi:sporulation protein YlmC with PRC-barrel domain